MTGPSRRPNSDPTTVVRLELLVDQTFIPSELGVGDDARELGVRVLTVYVEPI